ncbi:unnamed protein product, partial [Staurois parvus]
SLRCAEQGRTDHSSTRALPEGPWSVGDPKRCPCTFHWLFHRLFWVLARTQGPMIPYCPGAP